MGLSRKGKKNIKLTNGVTIAINSDNVVVKGKDGQLTIAYPNNLLVIKQNGDEVNVEPINDSKRAKVMHGTIGSILFSAVEGLAVGYTKTLKIVGVGYKAAVSGNKLTLAIGFSHPVVFEIPEELKVTTPTPTEIIIKGYNKIIVGEFAANVRATRGPEPYKGKGIAYSDEHIIRKVGKTAEGAKK
ncbi:50S ribosomal protein L6 [Bacilli bacterium]|nr:50S ribosomal protein L6 [Bacilli bacterium]